MFAPLAFVLQLSAFWVPAAYAQYTNIECGSEYDWMKNSMGQSPCLVVAWLQTPCSGTGNSSMIGKKTPGSLYDGPDSKDPEIATSCKCNTVYYSLVGGCAACQDNVGVYGWVVFSDNCAAPVNGSYPNTIPAGTAIPEWAYLDVTRNNTFDINAAKSLAAQGRPDVTGSEGPPTFASSTSSSSASVPTSQTSGSIAASSSRGRSSTNAGAIAGGVIGALTGLLLVGTIVFCLIRRNRRRARRNWSSENPQGVMSRANEKFSHSPETTSYHVPTLKGFPGSFTRLYDPDDPRTYPTRSSDDKSDIPSRTTPQTLAGGVSYTGQPQIMI